MSMYVLDTDTFQLFQEEHPRVMARVVATAPEDLAISVITVEEQLSGWYAQLRQAKQPERLLWGYRRLAATARFLSRVQIVDFEEAAFPPHRGLVEVIIGFGTNGSMRPLVWVPANGQNAPTGTLKTCRHNQARRSGCLVTACSLATSGRPGPSPFKCRLVCVTRRGVGFPQGKRYVVLLQWYNASVPIHAA